MPFAVVSCVRLKYQVDVNVAEYIYSNVNIKSIH